MSAASDAALAIPALLCCYADSIDAGRFVDYIEMDAASNRGVDEMVALLDLGPVEA